MIERTDETPIANVRPDRLARVKRNVTVSVGNWVMRGRRADLRWELKNGLRVRVTGAFAATKHVGQYTFHNEIEARQIQVLK